MIKSFRFATLIAGSLAITMTGDPASAKDKGPGAPGKPVQMHGQGNTGKGNPGQGNNPGQGGTSAIESTGRALTDALITAAEISIIRDYVSGHRGSLPSNLANPKPIPPGIQKNLARGKPMPPGIQKTRMPDGLLGRLPHYQGYEWSVIGSDVVLIQAATGLIADIARNLF